MSVQCWQLIYVVGISAFICGLIVANIVIEKIQAERKARNIQGEHEPPSWFVKAYETYLTWTTVMVCQRCQRHAHYVDFCGPNDGDGCAVCDSKNTWYRKPLSIEAGYWSLARKKWIIANKNTWSENPNDA